MTTTEPAPTPAVESAKAPKEHTILDAMKRGREYAALLVLVVTFAHSLYASYFKKEHEAEAGYKTTKDAMEGYSRSVALEVEALKQRIDDLEKQTKATETEHTAQTPAAKPPTVKKPNPVVEKPVIVAHPFDPSMATTMMVDLPDGAKPVNTNGPLIKGLVLSLPDAPWEQKAKK